MKKLQTDLPTLYREMKDSFDHYADLLLRWNAKINLTTITKRQEIEELHFLDSLSVVAWLRETENVSRETFSVFDIGAGAGFPGLPMKIIESKIDLTLIDSIKKKCDFMKEVSRSLFLKNVRVIHDRVSEQVSFGLFDCVVSRAAFKLKDLMLHSLPNLKADGFLIAMKSLDIEEEIKEGESVSNRLGYSSFDFVRYTLPYSKQDRQLVVLNRI